MTRILTSLIGLAIVLSISGCTASKPTVEFKKGSIYEHKELMCIGSEPNLTQNSIHIGVGSVMDLTGKNEKNTLGSTFISQGGSQMMVSALMNGGGHLVNRHNVDVMMWEKNAAVDKWLGDKGTQNYRKINVGQLVGSDYYITGAITTLDMNTNSGGIEGKVNGIGGGYRYHEIVVGGDFIITDTKTSEIIFAETFHLRLYSEEIEAGVFKLFGNDVVNLGAGFVTNDPLQLSTRYMIDTAAVKMLRKVYTINKEVCDLEVTKEESVKVGVNTEDAGKVGESDKAKETETEPKKPVSDSIFRTSEVD